MRTFLLIFGTVILLAGGYGVYCLWQPTTTLRAGRGVLPQPMAMNAPRSGEEDGLAVGPGEGPWVRQFDDRGRLSNAFRATRYEPQRGGLVKVTDPESVFFLKDGRRLKLKGRDGDVFVREGRKGESGAAASNTGGMGGPTRPPSRGRLNDVRIEMFEDPADRDPALVLTMNNVVFDNDTFRIVTDSFTNDRGEVIPGDEVPVVIRSRDRKYEFDGRGLTIRWNDRDQRLEMLEITHGERMLVNDPALMSRSATNVRVSREPLAASRSNPTPSEESAKPQAAEPVALTTDALQVAPPPVIAPMPPPTVNPPGAKKTKPQQPPYRITFHEGVQIRQGEQTLVRGVNLMQVDLALPKQEPESDEKSEDAPEPAPAPPAEAPAPPTTAPTDPAPPASTGETTAPPASEPASPATQPAEPPIILYWTGKLRIMPLPGESDEAPPAALASASDQLPGPLAPGQGVVRMFADPGQPVVLTRDGGEVYCAAVTYRTADSSLTLYNSPQLPEVVLRKFADDDPEMIGPPQATIFTERLDYSPDRRLATLHGRSRAKLPLSAGKSDIADAPPAEPKADEMLDVAWTGVGNLHLSGEGNATTLDRLELAGDVDVKTPQVALQSQRLEMVFEQSPAEPAPSGDSLASDVAPTTRPARLQPAVRRLTAAERVFCQINDADGQSRTLWCDKLDLDTARSTDGKPYPRQIDAIGHVRAIDGEQNLSAGRLLLTLAPAAAKSSATATQPALARSDSMTLELQGLVATENVVVASADGRATAGELRVTRKGETDHHVELLGEPFAEAVDNKGNILRGPRIAVEPKTGRAQVVGPGSLHALQEDAAGGPARPMDVAWTGGATVDGPRDRIDVTGDAVVTALDADGTVNTAKAGRVQITLAPRPPEPATPVARRPTAAASQPSTRPATQKSGTALAAVPTDVFKDKQVAAILLEEDAVINSRLATPDGRTVLREFQLDAPRIIYDVLKDKLSVPAAGRMLVRDHRDPEPRRPGAPAGRGGVGSARGATAFSWRESMEYDQGRRRAVMSGGVEVAYRSEQPGEPLLNLTGDRVTADFLAQPVKAASAKPATRPAGAGGGLFAGQGDMKLDLKRLTATGRVIVTRGPTQLAAERITFDPAAQVITATGSDRDPAVLSQTDGRGSTAALEMQWNTQTWHVKITRARARTR